MINAKNGVVFHFRNSAFFILFVSIINIIKRNHEKQKYLFLLDANRNCYKPWKLCLNKVIAFEANSKVKAEKKIGKYGIKKTAPRFTS